MTNSSIAALRLYSQKLVAPALTTPKELVHWMGAVQAQDYPMAKWAVGSRLRSSTNPEIETAINSGEILRVHLLRPTWHFVTEEDISWLLDLTAHRIKSAQRARERALEIDEQLYSQSNDVFEKALRYEKYLSRDELIKALNQAGIATDQNRASHLLANAELDKVICIGPIHNGKPTYASFSDRVKLLRSISKDEALSLLATRYFTSRCPATLQDFTWWSGLSAPDAHKALEMIKPGFRSEVIDGISYWFPDSFSEPAPLERIVHLLPAYDELILSYRNRGASIPPELESHLKVISDRGVFMPVFTLNGQVIGIWKRKLKKSKLIIETEFFHPPDKDIGSLVEIEKQRFSKFLGL